MTANTIRESTHPAALLSAICQTERVIDAEFGRDAGLWTPERLEKLRQVARDFDALFVELNAAEAERLTGAA